MKAIYFSLAVLVIVGLSGCNNHSTPGGPGVNATTNPLVGPKDDTFELKPPPLATSLKQTESKTISIGIKRGKNFDQDVALSFDKLPEGVTIDPAKPAIKHGEDEAKISIKAEEKAAIGDFTVKVTGHPKTGADGSTDLKIKVEKK